MVAVPLYMSGPAAQPASQAAAAAGPQWHAQACQSEGCKCTPAPPPSAGRTAPLTRVLFVGNSFTYGPPARLPGQTGPDQGPLNNLPRLFELVASSLNVSVETGEDTIGGCTMYAHRPSACPLKPAAAGAVAPAGCERVAPKIPTAAVHGGFPRLADSPCFLNRTERASCAIPCGKNSSDKAGAPCAASIHSTRGTYHPCPQLATLGGPWNFIVFQTHSALVGVRRARELMLEPAALEYARLASKQNATLVAYMTWAYPNGSGLTKESNYTRRGGCPAGSKAGCFPLGSLAELSEQSGTNCNSSDAWEQTVGPYECQAYALGRGYSSLLDAPKLRGAASLAVAPAGLAWQVARGAAPPSEARKKLVDAEYNTTARRGGPAMKLLQSGGGCCGTSAADAALFAGLPGSAKPQRLFRDKGPTNRWSVDKHNKSRVYNNKYCLGCTTDHHPSLAGMYLNALVIFATIFGKSPIGAAFPHGCVGTPTPFPQQPRKRQAQGHAD